MKGLKKSSRERAMRIRHAGIIKEVSRCGYDRKIPNLHLVHCC